MKKILLTLGLLTITVLPVLAANWVILNPTEALYLDTTSISKYNFYGRNNIYSMWTKNLNNNSHSDLKSTTSFNSFMGMHLIDCNTKETTIKSGTWYDSNGQNIQSITIDNYQLKWEPIIPGSVGEAMYNYACGGYR